MFVPSENQDTDDQLGRAQYAEEEGLGFCLRVSEIERFEEIVLQLLDIATRERIRHACRQRIPENGASMAAERIAALVQLYTGNQTGLTSDSQFNRFGSVQC